MERGQKMTIFRSLETLEGTFVRKHMSQFGMHIRSVLSGLYAENVNTDPKILI